MTIVVSSDPSFKTWSETLRPKEVTTARSTSNTMAIFGDVNDNRVIPLILMSGLIFLAGMYIFYIYRWVRNFLTGKSTTKSCKISTTNEFPPIDPYIHMDMERKQSMHWEPDSTVVIFQPSVQSIHEEDIDQYGQTH